MRQKDDIFVINCNQYTRRLFKTKIKHWTNLWLFSRLDEFLAIVLISFGNITYPWKITACKRNEHKYTNTGLAAVSNLNSQLKNVLKALSFYTQDTSNFSNFTWASLQINRSDLLLGSYQKNWQTITKTHF